jgi:hypothetical protein
MTEPERQPPARRAARVDQPSAAARIVINLHPVGDDSAGAQGRDAAYYDELRESVGRGTPTLLFGTSTRSLHRSLDRLRGVRRDEPEPSVAKDALMVAFPKAAARVLPRTRLSTAITIMLVVIAACLIAALVFLPSASSRQVATWRARSPGPHRGDRGRRPEGRARAGCLSLIAAFDHASSHQMS